MADESPEDITSQRMAETVFDRGEPEDANPKAAPTKVGRFVLLEEVGRGAMGVVYAAYDSDLDRKVAVKLLHRGERGDHRARLHREAQAMAKISHPNVVHVYEVGLHDERVYLAMEFVEGASLRRWLGMRERTFDEIIEVFLAAGRGLAQAHKSDLVHRDFKPDNVLVGRDDVPRVVDFGLARAIGETEAITSIELADNALASAPEDLTLTGAVLGTPAYMSPEQFSGETATAASDQFSFCVALWQALCGERPFRGRDPVTLAFQVRAGKRQPMPSHANVPAGVRKALERGLSLDPADRWPSMDELLDAITPRERGRGRTVAIAAGITLLMGAGVGAYITADTDPGDPCEFAGVEVAEIWNNKRGSEVRAALTAAGPDYASTVASRVDADLDEYAAGIERAAKQTCEATYHRNETTEHMLDLQRDCLDQRLSALDGLATQFGSADATVLERAQEASAALPEIETCLDDKALLAAVPPPVDPDVAAEVRRIRKEHAALSGALNTGRYTEALDGLRELETEAEALGYVPLRAELALDVAFAVESTASGDAVFESLERAYALGVEAGDVAVIVAAATDLGGSLGYREQRFDAASAWLTVARAHLPKLPSGALAAEAEIEDAEGTIWFRQVHYDKAVASFDRAARLYAKAGDELSELNMLSHKAVVLITEGELETGGAIMQDVRDKTAAALGENHPDVGVLTQNVAAVADRMGDTDRSLELYEEAIAIAEKSRGRNHPSYSVPLSTVANILFRKGELAQAREKAELSRELLDASTVTMDSAEPYLALGRIDLAEGKLADARAHVERANEILEQTAGKDHPTTASARTKLAGIELADGNHDRALELLQTARAATEGHEGAREAGDVYFMLAKVHFAKGESDAARTWAGKALAWFERISAAGDPGSEITAWLETTGLAPSEP